MKDFSGTLKRWIALVGPGLFCLGFTIGTGSVTTMVNSGGRYGLALLPVLALSAFFTWVMTEAYGRYGVVTGQTAIHAQEILVKKDTDTTEKFYVANSDLIYIYSDGCKFYFQRD